jgi:ATP-dependent Lon protease
VPEDVRNELVFVPVETVEEVLKEALGIEMPRTLLTDIGNNFVPVQNV